jgi:crotonobetainyl-CoA:carnitine CoA-transferase CaiB-like acyl-CoA transferase
VQITTLANQAMNYLVGGKPPKRQGNAHPNIVPYQAFPTSDGHIVIAVGNDAQFARFAQILGVPQLAQDERFATNAQRVVNRTLLIEMIASKILLRKSGELLGELETYQIPAAPINDMAAVFSDPQVEARGLLLKGPVPAQSRAVSLLANPIRISHASVSSTKPPPRLGEDTDSVLSTLLGRSAEQITRLRREGVI